MNKFAVIRIGGKQYKVTEGAEILVDKLSDTTKVEPEVLLIADGDNVTIGNPVLEKVKLGVKVVSDVVKADKVRVFKYKAKSRYRKLRGFRAQHTKLLVEKF